MVRAALFVALVFFVFAGCVSRQPAPVSDRGPAQTRVMPPPAAAKPAAPAPAPTRPDTYTVKHGDTLFSIAREKGLDFRELAAWNNLENAGAIREGQQLRLAPPPGTVATAPLRAQGGKVESRPLEPHAPASKPVPSTAATPPLRASVERVKTGPKAARIPYSEQAWAQTGRPDAVAEAKPEPKPEAGAEPKPEPKADTARAAGDAAWIWPAAGKVIATFNGTTSKGIDIAGKMGQPVIATAAGRVIYSGVGPRGLGKFVVIQHTNDYISIYGNNRELLVKEKQTVTRGQQIAEMGDSDADQVKLHFEIRRFSKPIDPLTLLPGRG